MLVFSRIKFYLPIGMVAASIFYLLVQNKISAADLVISTFIYFITGLFLGWRIEYKILLSSFLLLMPVTMLISYFHFTDPLLLRKYMYAITVITFFIGLLVSKFWNSKNKSVRLYLVFLLLVSIFSFYEVYYLIIA